jgi:mRNA-degrading endonuclease toxin of MazEF toxin-antitoxin module
MIAETILASDDAQKSGGLALVGVFTNKTIIYPRNVLAKTWMIVETILASDDAEKSGGLALVGVFTNKTIIYPRNVLASPYYTFAFSKCVSF